jgi:hypothetical protein
LKRKSYSGFSVDKSRKPSESKSPAGLADVVLANPSLDSPSLSLAYHSKRADEVVITNDSGPVRTPKQSGVTV